LCGTLPLMVRPTRSLVVTNLDIVRARVNAM
jgi:hypothetical protein